MAAIRAFADSDHAFVAWRIDAPIPGCRGFALKRRSSDPREAVEVLDTWVGVSLGGPVAGRLPRLLASTLRRAGELRAAVSGRDAPQLLGALKAFGPKAHVILADGADAPDDKNADARRALEQAGVDVLD